MYELYYVLICQLSVKHKMSVEANCQLNLAHDHQKIPRNITLLNVIRIKSVGHKAVPYVDFTVM